jgi:hypothetical protein
VAHTRENPPGCAPAGFLNASRFGDFDDHGIAQNTAAGQAVHGDNSLARLRHLARRLHALGEKPLYHFLDEVERGAPLRPHLEAYARLFPLAGFIREHHGDEFAPPRVIGGAP